MQYPDEIIRFGKNFGYKQYIANMVSVIESEGYNSIIVAFHLDKSSSSYDRAFIYASASDISIRRNSNDPYHYYGVFSENDILLQEYETEGYGDNKHLELLSSGLLTAELISENPSSQRIFNGNNSLYYYSNNPINIINNNGTEGLLYWKSLSSSDYDNYFNPVDNPLPTIDDEVNMSVPYNDAPDTNLEVPTNSIDNPITLETVIAGLNALDGFFDQGNTIMLADGTIIGKLAEAVRATENDLSGSTVQDPSEPWLYDIPILGDILQWLKKIYSLLSGTKAFSFDGILDEPMQIILDRIGIDAFNDSFEAFEHMQTGYGEPPKIYINLHDLVETAQNVEHFNNQFADEDTLLIDFAKLEEIQFMGMTLIQLIRSMMSLAMITITVFYIHRKLEPDTII